MYRSFWRWQLSDGRGFKHLVAWRRIATHSYIYKSHNFLKTFKIVCILCDSQIYMAIFNIYNTLVQNYYQFQLEKSPNLQVSPESIQPGDTLLSIYFKD